MKKIIIHFLPFFLLSLSIAYSGEFSGVEPFIKWNKRKVSVCFGVKSHLRKVHSSVNYISDEPFDFQYFDQNLKQVVKETVKKEYTVSKTGIEFVGWKNCNANPIEDVIIFTHTLDYKSSKNGETLGMATMGESGDFERRFSMLEGGYYGDPGFFNKGRGKSFIFLTYRPEKYNELRLSSLKSLKLTTLHEFGHLSGLRHEHARFEGAFDPNCLSSGTRTRETLNVTTVLTSTYDSNSIMNYCWMRVLRKAGDNIILTNGNYKTVEKILLFGLDDLLEFKFFSLNDSSLLTREKVGKDLYKVKMNIGLSQKDKHALKCLYVDGYDNCHKDFNKFKLHSWIDI